MSKFGRGELSGDTVGAGVESCKIVFIYSRCFLFTCSDTFPAGCIDLATIHIVTDGRTYGQTCRH